MESDDGRIWIFQTMSVRYHDRINADQIKTGYARKTTGTKEVRERKLEAFNPSENIYPRTAKTVGFPAKERIPVKPRELIKNSISPNLNTKNENTTLESYLVFIYMHSHSFHLHAFSIILTKSHYSL